MNAHTEEGKGHRRTKSGRSSKRSSRSDIVDNDLLSRRASRNEDERKSQRTRQKIELRAKQLNNTNEEAGSSDATPAPQGGSSNLGHGFLSGDGTLTSVPQLQYEAPTRPSIMVRNMETPEGQNPQPPRKPGFEEWLGEHLPEESGGDEIQDDIERLRVSNTSPGGWEPMRGVSPHRWGRVFAERAAPLSRIGSEALQPALSSPGTPPLVRRAAVRRRRMHASDTTITNPIDFVGLSSRHSLPPPPPITPGEGNDSPDISPISTRGSIHWKTPSTVTPATSVLQTLPLSYRLPMTPTKNSQTGNIAGPCTAGLPRPQNFNIPQFSLSLSVPNSPDFHAINLAFQSGTSSTSQLNSNWRLRTDPKTNVNTPEDSYQRARSASPMVHGHDPRLRAVQQSEITQRSFDGTPPSSAEFGRDSMRQGSPGLRQSTAPPESSSYPTTDGNSPTHPRKSSKAGGKVIRLRCVVCIEKYGVNKMIQAPNCMHFLCTTCVTELFRKAIRNPEDGCPVNCCNAEIPVETVSGLLSSNECDEYSRLVKDCNIVVEKIYCHIPTCAEFIPPFAVSRDSRAKCLKCHSLTCGVCKRGWHTGPCTHWENA